MRITPDDIADLTALIFAAALDPARWQDFLEHLHKTSGGIGINMFGRDMATGHLFGFMSAGYDDSFMVGYDAHFRHLNVWVDNFAPTSKGTYMSTAEMYPHEELFKTEFYNDWVKPQDDMHGGGAVMLFNEQDRFLAFGSHIRGKDRDKLEDGFERIARLLTPHVQQAFEINRTLEGKAVAEFVAGMNDSASTAILLLARDGKPVFANATAEIWIAKGMAIHVDAFGRLTSGQPDIAEFLERSLHGLKEAEKGQSLDFKTSLPGRRTELTFRTARFTPDRQARSPFGVLYSGDDRALLVTIERKENLRQDAVGMLRQRRLSPAELDIALALAQGLSAQEIADRRNVSIHTIRNQRQAILSKLGLHRQSQLVRLIMDLQRS